MNIRPTTPADTDAVFRLYQRVAAVPGGLARLEAEVTEDYVSGFIISTLEHGTGFVAVDTNGEVRGEIHAYSPGLFCFSHVLSDLTIAVDPDIQGQGLGRQLFEAFMTDVRDELPEILRIELIARESNARAIAFYETLGFVREGEFRGRIRNVDGSIESDVPMGWQRESQEYDAFRVLP